MHHSDQLHTPESSTFLPANAGLPATTERVAFGYAVTKRTPSVSDQGLNVSGLKRRTGTTDPSDSNAWRHGPNNLLQVR
jgi:hypothetical protein